jgi:hypothetical protein
MNATDDWGIVVMFPAEARDFSLLHSIQAGCETYPEFYPTGPMRSSFLRSKKVKAYN